MNQDPLLWVSSELQIGPRLLSALPVAGRLSRWERLWWWLRLPLSALWRR